jgi:transcriptional regulator with XRE-family HTH domain
MRKKRPHRAESRVQEIRFARGANQADIARAAGISPGNFWKVDKGFRPVTHRYAQALAAALEVTIEELYASVGSPIPLASSTPGRRDLVDDPDELAWLDFWRGLDQSGREAVTTLLLDAGKRAAVIELLRRTDGGRSKIA